MNTKLRSRFHCGALIALFTIGCGTVDQRPVPLEVFSWWQELSERSAFSRLVAVHQAAHAAVEVRSTADWAASVTRPALTARMLAGAPPATFQANLGADLLRWTTVDYVSLDGIFHSESRVQGLSRLYQDLGLASVFPRAVLEALSIGQEDGEYYAVPINIHRINMLYYSRRRLAAFEAEHGQSFLDLALLCPEDWANTSPLDLEIAIGTRDTFTLILLAFENLLPALSGGAFYDDLFRGLGPRSQLSESDWTFDVRRALQCLKYLSRSFIDRHGELTWGQATARVANDQADFTVMGDWAEGLLTEAFARGAVESSVFPRTEELYVFTSDTFPLPFETPHPVEAEEFLRTIAGGTAQLEFSREKGSIPARTDLDSALDPRSLSKRNAFQTATPILATSGLFPGYFPVDTLGEALRVMVYPGAGAQEIENVITIFRDAYPLLSRWQERLANGPASPPPPP